MVEPLLRSRNLRPMPDAARLVFGPLQRFQSGQTARQPRATCGGASSDDDGTAPNWRPRVCCPALLPTRGS